MSRTLALPALLITILAGSAWWLVFGSGMGSADSLLAGQVLLAGLVGGAAVALSPGALLVLAPLAAVVADSVRGDARASGTFRRRAVRGVGFMAGFAAAFVVVISGAPGAVADLVYRSARVIDLGAGAVLLLYGVGAVARPAWGSRSVGGRRHRRRWIGPARCGVLGSVVGLLLAHKLDPLYDSVFFLTGNGVAASHAPLTVAAFTLGLSLVVLSLTGLALMPAGHPMVGGWISGGLSVAGGLATAVLGAAVLAGRFSAIRSMLLS